MKNDTVKYTRLFDTEGDPMQCGGGGCSNDSVLEFYGFCERCWLDLTPEERAILKGEEPPVVEVRREVVTIKHAPPGPVARAIGFLWRLGVTAAVGYLLWFTR